MTKVKAIFGTIFIILKSLSRKEKDNCCVVMAGMLKYTSVDMEYACTEP